jgi:hypothetical protein
VTSLGGGDGGNTTSHHALPRHGDTQSPEGAQHDARRLSGAGTRHDCADLSVLDEKRCIVRPSGVQDHSRINRVTRKALRVQLDDLQGPASIIISLSTIISATCYYRSSRKVRVAVGGAPSTTLTHHRPHFHSSPVHHAWTVRNFDPGTASRPSRSSYTHMELLFVREYRNHENCTQ